MRLHIARATASAGLAFFASFAALAAPPAGTFVDRLGDQPVTLPIPPGLANADGPAAAVGDMLRRALPSNYRFIGLQVPQDYLDKVRAHDPSAKMPRYCTVMTYRDYESGGMTPELFGMIKKTFREQGDKLLAQVQAQAASAVDHMSRDVASLTGDSTTSLKVGDSTSLGVFDDRPNSFALAAIGPVTVSSKTVNETSQQATVIVIMLVHGKPINANFYADYGSKADLAWTEDQARDWIRRVNELNP